MKTCQNCKQNFTIDSEDFAFYERIKVPPPTFCPQCRFQRRLSWRNGWHLFKNNDARDGKEIFSFFPRENNIPVYDRDFWFSDGWDPLDYGRDYDFSRPFFEQFKDFLKTVPQPAHSSLNLVNCRFCINVADCKNCYLVRGSVRAEDCAYMFWDKESRQCMDSHMTNACELGYGNVNARNCYKTVYSVDCDDCSDMIFSNDCTGCNNCIGCVGLRGKSYCIFNQQYSKEEYSKKLAEMNLGSQASFQKVLADSRAFWLTSPQKFMHGVQNANVSGDYVYGSKNAKQCYRVSGVEDSKFVQNILGGPVKSSYDYTNFGENAEYIYECLITARGASNIKFCTQVYLNVKNIEYSIFCRSVSDCFGCISLRNKQYCIFNKQYTRDEYEALVAKIKIQMTSMPYIDKAGHVYKYGEFFPPELSTVPYRISEAYEFFPLSEQRAKEQGFVWYDIAHQEHKATLPAEKLPDHIADANDEILKQTMECEHASPPTGGCDQECTKAFRIIPEELTFLRRMNIPLPRLCPNCRLYERFKLRNPPVFYHRQCDKCAKDIETSYAPDRPETVYCEQCYQKEIL